MKSAILEVIACSVEDAIEAGRGGANRLEIISRFDVGGLTPSPDLVREIKAKVSLPLRVMLRESAGYGVSGEAEIEKLCAAARVFSEIGVDGIVLGFMRGDEIDFALTQKILAYAPHLKATFHHAFEDANDKFAAIEKLKKMVWIDRILSHGGSAEWMEKRKLLGIYAQRAQPEIEILAGGGVDAEAIKLLLEKTSVREFHVGSAARENGKVKSSRVAKLARALGENYD
ncbi:MAG: hypothetical protein M3367_16395 [Acidobacteriota bacterium]|nr:hypothetical protein [Acidobacteriota bacterium]